MVKIVIFVLALITFATSEMRPKRYSNFYSSNDGSFSSASFSGYAFPDNSQFYQSYLNLGQPYISTAANYQPSYAKFCEDICSTSSYNPHRKVDLELSPQDSTFFQNTINYEVENCICMEKVPKDQDHGLCSYNLKYYDICDLTCQGRGNTKLVNVFGSKTSYIRGQCVNKDCYCSVRQLDYPMKTTSQQI